MAGFGANFGENFGLVQTGVVLEGDHSRAFYGDVRFDKIRTREERLHTFTAIGAITRHQSLGSITGRLLREHKLTTLRSKITKLNEFTTKAKITKIYHTIMEGAVIDKNNQKLYQTISQNLQDLKEQKKHTKLKKMWADYENEFSS